MIELSPYAAKPWLALYTPGLPATLVPAADSPLGLFAAAAAKAGDRPAVHYFDRSISYRELDAMSDSLAAALIDIGFARGDRLAVYLQNMPAFLIAILGGWKAGGIVVPINPMYREHELCAMFADSQPKAIVALDTLWRDVIATLPPEVPRPSIESERSDPIPRVDRVAVSQWRSSSQHQSSR